MKLIAPRLASKRDIMLRFTNCNDPELAQVWQGRSLTFVGLALLTADHWIGHANREMYQQWYAHAWYGAVALLLSMACLFLDRRVNDGGDAVTGRYLLLACGMFWASLGAEWLYRFGPTPMLLALLIPLIFQAVYGSVRS